MQSGGGKPGRKPKDVVKIARIIKDKKNEEDWNRAVDGLRSCMVAGDNSAVVQVSVSSFRDKISSEKAGAGGEKLNVRSIMEAKALATARERRLSLESLRDQSRGRIIRRKSYESRVEKLMRGKEREKLETKKNKEK
ncbi:MAG: hypothetical protein LBU15_04050 [Rickettsiales bacterium]|jgi:hypothetical protein|nr:hypothetical protein [Rickettsiales bacterium]